MSHLLPSYATGGLEPEEYQRVRRHLRHCTHCRKLAAQYQTAFDAIGLIVPVKEPPVDLKDRILYDLPPQPPYQLPKPIRFILDHPKAVVAASLAILLTLAGSIWINIAGIPARKAFPPGAAHRTAQVPPVAERSVGNSAPQGRGTQIDPTKAADGILTVLNGTAAAPRARAIITVGANATSAVLYAFGLPEPPEGHVYQLWLIKGTIHRNGGIIRVTPKGHAVHFIRTQEPISEYVHFGITLEPASGSAGPTGSKILENETQEKGQLQDGESGSMENVPTSMNGIVPE